MIIFGSSVYRMVMHQFSVEPNFDRIIAPDKHIYDLIFWRCQSDRTVSNIMTGIVRPQVGSLDQVMYIVADWRDFADCPDVVPNRFSGFRTIVCDPLFRYNTVTYLFQKIDTGSRCV